MMCKSGMTALIQDITDIIHDLCIHYELGGHAIHGFGLGKWNDNLGIIWSILEFL